MRSFLTVALLPCSTDVEIPAVTLTFPGKWNPHLQVTALPQSEEVGLAPLADPREAPVVTGAAPICPLKPSTGEQKPQATWRTSHPTLQIPEGRSQMPRREVSKNFSLCFAPAKPCTGHCSTVADRLSPDLVPAVP